MLHEGELQLPFVPGTEAGAVQLFPPSTDLLQDNADEVRYASKYTLDVPEIMPEIAGIGPGLAQVLVPILVTEPQLEPELALQRNSTVYDPPLSRCQTAITVEPTIVRQGAFAPPDPPLSL